MDTNIPTASAPHDSLVRRLFSLGSILKTTATVAAAVLVAVIATQGTYAIWNRSGALSTASTVSAASAALTVGTLTASGATVLYPGLTSYQTASVTNPGAVALALNLQSLTESTTATTFSNALSVSLGFVASSAACVAGFSSAWTGSLGSVTSTSSHPNLAKTLASATGTSVLCVAVTLPSGAPATTKVTAAPVFALTLGGTAVS